MKMNLFSRIARALMAPPVTTESLAAEYAALPDIQLRQINPAQLTSLARPLWAAELERRNKSVRKHERVA